MARSSRKDCFRADGTTTKAGRFRSFAQVRVAGRRLAQGLLLVLWLFGPGPARTDTSPNPDGYRNPVIHADYSDPDALRVGADYFLTSSSFSHVPGLPILHSTDLVHWEIVNHAVRLIPPRDHFSVPRHGAGIWAPAFRIHEGRYFIYYGDPDFGIYVTTADHPRGAWSEPRLVLPGKGLIDPAPFWDDDGSAYLIHAWARSRAGFNNILTLHRMSGDGQEVLDEGRTVVDGNRIDGWRTIEGPKLYKRDGFYYIFAPAGGVRNGWQGVFRSRSIGGPYEHRIVLEQGATRVNGPHQGALVTTPRGEDWFLHFQDKDAYGRIVHLQPVSWVDGWPVMGDDPDGDGTGEPVFGFAAPHPETGAPYPQPQTSDAFDGGFNLAWQWQANPEAGWLAAPPPAGRLRLATVPVPDNLWEAGNLLMQKFPAETFSVETLLEFAPSRTGETAGLIVFGRDYSWIGLERTRQGTFLVQRQRPDADAGGEERIIERLEPDAQRLFLRLDVTAGAQCRFSYSRDGRTFAPFGKPFTARQGRWVGAKAGVFSGRFAGHDTGAAEPQRSETAAQAAYADFLWWRVVVH